MQRLLMVFAVLMGMTSAAHAEGLKALMTGDDTRGLEGVGRLNIDNRSMCTGALIAPDLVLTAAHCLFDKASQRRVDVSKIEFLAGWRNGRASAYRWVESAVVHPNYRYSVSENGDRVHNDIALLRLSQPIRNASIAPFETGPRPRKGADIGVVSYAHDRSEAPSLQEECGVLALRRGTVVLSCSVDFGSSGAPVFETVDGVRRIVSVISAKAEMDGRKVSLGTAVGDQIEELRAAIGKSPSAFSTGTPLPSRITVGGDQNASGAKFLRP